MSEMQQVLNCLGEMMLRIDKLDARISALEKKLDTRISALEKKLDTRISALEKKLDTRISALEKKLDTQIAALDRKIDMVEFGLGHEIQKVYEIALKNQANIELLLAREYSYSVDTTARHRVGLLGERVDVVETVVESHSDAICKLRNAMA